MGMLNAVTNDTAKTKVILFSKSHRQRLSRQLRETRNKFGNEHIMLNKE